MLRSGGSQLVPFRESVLTWYLRESLAGNARTTMLAACSPVLQNKEETLSTLRYAASAKNIKTAAAKNEDPMEAKVRELAEEIQALKKALAEAGGAAPGPSKATDGGGGAAQRMDAGAVMSADYVNSLNEEEREAYLESLQTAMRTFLPGGFGNGGVEPGGGDTFARGRVASMDLDLAGPAETYPLLSCLNKDDMLSHAMTVPVVTEGGGKFCIGRSGGASDNDFTLNGVGMQVRHAAIEPSWDKEGHQFYSIAACVAGACVLVNGTALPEGGEARRLAHGDRITLGPCRMLALWCEEPLSEALAEKWTYEAAFAELMHRESLQWTLLSPTRRRLLDKLKEADILYVEQANSIAMEMSSPVRFHATVILGGGVRGLHRAEVTVDELLSDEDGGPGGEVVVTCTVARPGEEAAKRRRAEERRVKAAARAFGRREEPDRLSMMSDTLELTNELSKGDETSSPLFARLDSAASDDDGMRGPGSFKRGVNRGQSISMFHSTLANVEEDDDDDLMMGLTPKASSGKRNFFGDDDEGEDVGGGGDGDRLDRFSRQSADAFEVPASLPSGEGSPSSHTLFEMKIDMFEDLVSELKATYSSMASLSQGVRDVMADEERAKAGTAKGGGGDGDGDGGDTSEENENIVRQIFDTICDSDDRTITRSDLSAAFNLFDETVGVQQRGGGCGALAAHQRVMMHASVGLALPWVPVLRNRETSWVCALDRPPLLCLSCWCSRWTPSSRSV